MSAPRYRGFDTFFSDPGEWQTRRCRVCGSVCNVQRMRYGPTNLSEAMQRINRYHDQFVCPHIDSPWHARATRLMVEFATCQDERLSQTLRTRLEAWLRLHGKTPPQAPAFDEVFSASLSGDEDDR